MYSIVDPSSWVTGEATEGDYKSIIQCFLLYFCRNLRRQDLRDIYNIVDPGVQERLLKAIYRAKEEDTDDDVSILYPPENDKTNKMTCASSKDWSARLPVHLHSLTRDFAVRRRKYGFLAIHEAHGKDSDQTAWMCMLIRVFAGYTCHLVGFVVLNAQSLRQSCEKCTLLTQLTCLSFKIWSSPLLI